jgi:hypothetical protein
MPSPPAAFSEHEVVVEGVRHTANLGGGAGISVYLD